MVSISVYEKALNRCVNQLTGPVRDFCIGDREYLIAYRKLCKIGNRFGRMNMVDSEDDSISDLEYRLYRMAVFHEGNLRERGL